MPNDRKRTCIINYAHFKLEEEYKYLKFDFIAIYIFFILPATFNNHRKRFSHYHKHTKAEVA